MIRRENAVPYRDNSQLPDGVKNNLPAHAQDIYKEAYNSAYEEYESPKDRQNNSNREETAHKVAWSAVKNKYQKDDDGSWHKKS